MSGRETERDAEGKDLIVIATAIPEEFEAIARAASCTRRGEPAVGSSSSGRMGKATVRVVLAGDGPARAASALSTFEEIPGLPSSPVMFIGAGVCGALSEGLAPGDVLVSSRILDDSGDAPAPSPALVERAVTLGAISATFVTVGRPLVSSSEKRGLAEQVDGGLRHPAAVDMESAGWARAAARRGLPFVVVRAVADTFEESLPDFLADCLDASGSIDRSAVARAAALRPWFLPRLLEMRARVRDSAARLGAFLSRFLERDLARG